MKCKYAKTASEMQEAQEDYTELRSERPYLNINEWSVADIDARRPAIGTHRLADEGQEDRQRGICRQGGEEAHRDDRDIDSLMQELIASHTLG